MLNKDKIRELAYLVNVDDITPMNADRLECAHIGGWHCVVGKDEFHVGDPAIYFEIDAKLPEVEPFCSMDFLVSKHYKIKSQKIRGEISQGLLIPVTSIGWTINDDGTCTDTNGKVRAVNNETRFVTKELNVVYALAEDNIRKGVKTDKYKKLAQRYTRLARTTIWRKLYKTKFGRKLLYAIFGHIGSKAKKTSFPTQFPYIHKTDQERVENMPWVLQEKVPYIRTQKCDGTSSTYILERKSFGRFEFYVCSRNVRMLTPTQENYYSNSNYYWDMAIKYNIKNKLQDYLLKHPNLKYVCWQGETCGPAIQNNAHQLKEYHLFLFHMIDSEKGFYDIREAAKIWEEYNMEHVPIEENLYILPDDMEEFKLTADGYYAAEVCEGIPIVPREGFVYYKADDPNFSFKNVSRKYLLKK